MQCYKFFIETLSDTENYSSAHIESLFNYLSNGHFNLLIVIDIDATDSEQDIFNAINNSGVRLSMADIVKNELFGRYRVLANHADDKAVLALYEQTWLDTFNATDRLTKYWDTETQRGRVKQDNLEILLHFFATIQGFYSPDKHALKDLTKIYEEKIKAFGNTSEIEAFLKELCSYATCYRENMTAFTDGTPLRYVDNKNRLLHLLSKTDISTWHAFVLYSLKNCSSLEQKVTFKRLENYIMRRFICGWDSKNYNKVSADLIKQMQDSDITPKSDPFADVPSDAELLNSLKSPFLKTKTKHARLFLLWLELARRNNPKFNAMVLSDNGTLEHIMPQKWEANWGESIKGDVIAEQKRHDHIGLIGNMTLLSGKLNAAISNSPFADKKLEMEKFADLTITKEVLALDDWDEQTIAARTEALSAEILKLWPLN